MEKKLFSLLKRIEGGIVMDIGAKNSPYRHFIKADRYITMDISEENNPDICCDVHDIKCDNEKFNAVIATEVLEHCYNPQKVINEIRRILVPGGTCILSTRFIHRYHPDPKDYFRFTRDSIEVLFSEFSCLEIYEHGNKVQTIWQILNTGWLKPILTPFNQLVALIQYKDHKFPLGFVIFAGK
jgi:SAM-dependent methyltransferase